MRNYLIKQMTGCSNKIVKKKSTSTMKLCFFLNKTFVWFVKCTNLIPLFRNKMMIELHNEMTQSIAKISMLLSQIVRINTVRMFWSSF